MTSEQKRKLAEAVDLLCDSEVFEHDCESANHHGAITHLQTFKTVLLRGDYDDDDYEFAS